MDVIHMGPRLSVSRLAAILATAWLAGCSFMGPTTATSFLKQVNESPDPNVRYKAYQALGSERVYDDPAQKRKAAQVLLARLEPDNEPLATRALICRTLGEIGDPLARETMVKMIRGEAIRALGKVGRPEDATVLMQAMKLDTDPNNRVSAIEALGLLKAADPRTGSYLVESMEDDDPRIRLAAYESLKRLSGQDLGVRTGPWRDLLIGRGLPKPNETRPDTKRLVIKNPFVAPDLGMKPKIAAKVYTDPYRETANNPAPAATDNATKTASSRGLFTDPFKSPPALPALAPAPAQPAPPPLNWAERSAGNAPASKLPLGGGSPTYTDPFKSTPTDPGIGP